MLSKPTLEEVNRKIDFQAGPNEYILLASYSEFEIPKGYVFDVIFDKQDANRNFLECNLQLMQITQSMLKDWDEIPIGHKTIVKVKTDNNCHSFMKQLPVVDSWKFGTQDYIIASLNYWLELSRKATKS